TTIRFINARKGCNYSDVSEIRISDNGHGMTLSQVKDTWMRIATTQKLREPISASFGRRKTGNKGVGRFACRRLAKRLVLETVAEAPGGFERTRVEFNWADFKPGSTLTEIPCTYEAGLLDQGSPGLSLKLIDLVEQWSESEFNLLRRQILGLSIAKGTRRGGYEEDPGFEVIFDAPEFPRGEGILADQFMDAGWGKLQGRVAEGGDVRLTLAANVIGTKEYHLPKTFHALKGMTFEVAWIPYRKDYWRDTRTLTMALAKQVMDEQSGVRVYLDGFRVYPYGDPSDDWLGIDRDVARRLVTADRILDELASTLGVDPRRWMLYHPRNRNLVGRVQITSSPDLPFQMKLDREGFIWNEACDELVEALRLSLQWMVLHYSRFVIALETQRLREAERAFESQLDKSAGTQPLVIRAVDALYDEAKRAVALLPAEIKEKSASQLEAAHDVIERSLTQTETYLGILRGAASAGTLMFSFSQEVKNLVARLDTHANTLDRIAGTLSPDHRHQFTEFASSLRKTRDRLDQQIQLFGSLAWKTTPAEKKLVSVRRICTEVVQGFQFLIEEYDMNPVTLEIGDELRAGPMHEVELFSIVVNLVSNAVKANLAGNGKNILIQGSKMEEKTVLRVFDDGLGLSPNLREKVFQPLMADPGGDLYEGLKQRIADKDLVALGRGSGIGLTIVRSIVETYGGQAGFVDAEALWKTCVEVVLP
ncbi:MAG: ATP-binding protein, partial [Chloroflexi bacterium]|nr:ATP-binding protein [Chloroflexota bacterium]